MGEWKDFFKWYLRVDWKDFTNYIAIVLAILLFWYGIKTMISAISMGP